jgi:hypothetical protein
MRTPRQLLRWVGGVTALSAGLVAGGFGLASVVAPITPAAASLAVATASRSAATTPSAPPCHHMAGSKNSTS